MVRVITLIVVPPLISKLQVVRFSSSFSRLTAPGFTVVPEALLWFSPCLNLKIVSVLIMECLPMSYVNVSRNLVKLAFLGMFSSRLPIYLTVPIEGLLSELPGSF